MDKIVDIFYWDYLASFGLFFLSYWAKGNMDFSAKGGFKGNKSYKNKGVSGDNKYKYPMSPYYEKWYYFGLITPKYEERFPYSTTIFVFLTDYWHSQQFIFLNSALLGVFFLLDGSLWHKIIVIAIIKLMYIIGFNTSFERER